MHINYDWLTEYCDCNLTAEEAASKLTMAGLNVEGIQEDEAGHPVLDIEVTANRNDCNNYIGVARELSVLTGSKLTLPDLDIPAERTGNLDQADVGVEDREKCPRYTARVVRDVDVGPSPDWLVERIESMGLQSVNNVVDITNYVLFEFGQPLHAFDLNLLEDNQIRVRAAKDGEELAALDGETYELSEEMLVIADASRPVAIAGIIGGQDTEVHAGTTDLVIESALFDPVNVRRTSRELGVSTESSYRFERGPDPRTVDLASRRAAYLIQEVADGTIESLYVDRDYQDPEATAEQEVLVRPERVNELLGVDIKADRLKGIFEGLGFEPAGTEEDALRYRIPTFRPDIEREEDMIEEAARIYGYDEISLSPGMIQSFSPPQQEEDTLNDVRQRMIGEGYREILTFPIQDRETPVPSYWSGDDPVGILNADGEVDRTLRRSLIPSFLDVLDTNHGYGKTDQKLFEVARVYRWRDEETPDEQEVLGLLREDDFRRIKGDVEELIWNIMREEVRYEELDHDVLHDAYAAELWLGHQPIGYIGRVAPSVLDRLDIQSQPFVCELDYHILERRAVHVNRYSSFSRYPPSPKDLAFIVDEELPWKTLEETIDAAGPGELEEVEMFDVFRSGDIGDDKKSVAVRLLFRSSKGTLETEQVNAWMKQIVDQVEDELPAELRGDLEHV